MSSFGKSVSPAFAQHQRRLRSRQVFISVCLYSNMIAKWLRLPSSFSHRNLSTISSNDASQASNDNDWVEMCSVKCLDRFLTNYVRTYKEGLNGLKDFNNDLAKLGTQVSVPKL